MIDEGRIEGAYPQLYEIVSDIQSKIDGEVETLCIQRMVDLNIDPEVVKLQAMEIQRLRALRQERDWIPCSERLPEETGKYLVWYDCGEDAEKGYSVSDFDEDLKLFGYWHDYYDSSSLGFLDSEFEEFETVVAWMPLPEPYKGE